MRGPKKSTGNSTANATTGATAKVAANAPTTAPRAALLHADFTAAAANLSRPAIVALFAAASLYLSSVEYVLPRPVPFFRFGLANIPLLLALRFFSFKDILVLVLLKVAGLGILNGTIASYVALLSLAGSLSGALVMYALARAAKGALTHIGVSVAGAMASNGVQIAFAVLYIFGSSAWVIAPYLLALGLLSGFMVGVIAQYFERTLASLDVLAARYSLLKNAAHKIPAQKNPAAVPEAHHVAAAKKSTAKSTEKSPAPVVLLLCGVLAGVAYAMTDALAARFAQMIIFFAAAATVKRIKVSYFLMLIASVAFFYALIPAGKVLASWGAFSLTQGALRNGLFHAFTLCGYVFLSLWCINPRLKLPGKPGALLSKALAYFYFLWDYAAAASSSFAAKGGGDDEGRAARASRQSASAVQAHAVDAALLQALRNDQESSVETDHQQNLRAKKHSAEYEAEHAAADHTKLSGSVAKSIAKNISGRVAALAVAGAYAAWAAALIWKLYG